MVAHVKVDGRWLDLMFVTSEVEHSSAWLVDEISGDRAAQVAIVAPRGYEAPFTLPYKDFELWSCAGKLLWAGVTDNPDRADDTITLKAIGIGQTLKWFQAEENVAGPGDPPDYMPTWVPNTAVDTAAERGARFSRNDVDLGSTALFEPEDGVAIDIETLLTRAAIAQGKRVHVDSQGFITYRDAPSAVKWMLDLSAAKGYMGTSDEQFVTMLFGPFLKAGGTPVPDQVWKEDEAGFAKFGPRERTIDLNGLGAITEAMAQAYIDGRLALIGGRMGWTEGVDLTSYNLRHVSGAFTDPRWVKAGDLFRIPGVVDSRSSPTTRASIDIILSEVRVTEASRSTAFVAPVGFSPRDWEGAVAPPENPAKKEAA